MMEPGEKRYSIILSSLEASLLYRALNTERNLVEKILNRELTADSLLAPEFKKQLAAIQRIAKKLDLWDVE